DRDAAADDAPIAAERLLPECVRHDRDVRRAQRLVVRREHATENRTHAEEWKEFRAHETCADTLRPVVRRENDAITAHEGNSVERRARAWIALPILRGGIRRRPKAAALLALEHHHHAAPVAERQ